VLVARLVLLALRFLLLLRGLLGVRAVLGSLLLLLLLVVLLLGLLLGLQLQKVCSRKQFDDVCIRRCVSHLVLRASTHCKLEYDHRRYETTQVSGRLAYCSSQASRSV